MLFAASIFLSLFSIAVCADVRVVGGTDAPEGKYPYVASLRLFGILHICTGSILNKRWILTAAHCVKGIFYAYCPSLVSVVLNTTATEGPDGDHYKAVLLISHSQYLSVVNDYMPLAQNDIGMVKVEREIEFSDRVQPIALPTKDFRKAGYPAVFAGWGRTSFSLDTDELPKTLQEIQLTVISNDKCKRSVLLVPITSSHICTLNKVGEGLCMGDSGGPLVADGVQIGIASFVVGGCASGRPDVSTRVYTFLDWINATQDKYDGTKGHYQNYVFYALSSIFTSLFFKI